MCRRLGPPQRPELWRHLNAFAVGNRKYLAFAITDGMLRAVTMRDLLAALAHEISHIANNDIWVMQLADTISRFTRIMFLIVIAMAEISVPIVLIREVRLLFPGVLLLILAPTLSGLRQLALSRNGEYDADLNGANLLGYSHALAEALRKIDYLARPLWRQLLLPGVGGDIPSCAVIRRPRSASEYLKLWFQNAPRLSMSLRPSSFQQMCPHSTGGAFGGRRRRCD